jgi:hypothetical protein
MCPRKMEKGMAGHVKGVYVPKEDGKGNYRSRKAEIDTMRGFIMPENRKR